MLGAGKHAICVTQVGATTKFLDRYRSSRYHGSLKLLSLLAQPFFKIAKRLATTLLTLLRYLALPLADPEREAKSAWRGLNSKISSDF